MNPDLVNHLDPKIQYISITVSFLFLLYIGVLIKKGRLREEYAIIWICCTLLLIFFSVWRDGLDVLSRLIGVYSPPNMVFIGSLFAILIYLLHLSVVVSRLHEQNKTLAREIALMKERLKSDESKK
ncbi:MAG: DUF2304 domain-containing protein [Flavobacteriales bacterium]